MKLLTPQSMDEQLDSLGSSQEQSHDVRISKSNTHMLVELSLPFAETRSLHTYLLDNCLLVSGNLQSDICKSEFLRLFHLPQQASHENIRAVFKSDTLTIRFKLNKGSEVEQQKVAESDSNLLNRILTMSNSQQKTYIPVIIR